MRLNSQSGYSGQEIAQILVKKKIPKCWGEVSQHYNMTGELHVEHFAGALRNCDAAYAAGQGPACSRRTGQPSGEVYAKARGNARNAMR